MLTYQQERDKYWGDRLRGLKRDHVIYQTIMVCALMLGLWAVVALWFLRGLWPL
jgi:hypothetical protein